MVLEKGGATFTDTGPVLYIVALDEPSRTWAFETAASLRSRGVAVEVDYLERSVKAQMRDANRVQAQHVIVVGEAELASGRVRLKNMATGEEIEAPLDQLPLATIREL
ncbi:MAG: His/Gly/Thr/Pro-type tRNA ligase C-terminal domain-containing protein, partial [Bacteroidota bacterium]